MVLGAVVVVAVVIAIPFFHPAQLWGLRIDLIIFLSKRCYSRITDTQNIFSENFYVTLFSVASCSLPIFWSLFRSSQCYYCHLLFRAMSSAFFLVEFIFLSHRFSFFLCRRRRRRLLLLLDAITDRKHFYDIYFY